MAESVVAGRSPGSIVKSLAARSIPTSRDVQNDFFGRPLKNYEWNTTQVIHILRSDLTRGYVMHRIHGPNKPPSRVLDPVTGEFIRREPLIEATSSGKNCSPLSTPARRSCPASATKAQRFSRSLSAATAERRSTRAAGARPRTDKHNVPYYQCRHMRTTCKPSRSVPRVALDQAVHDALLEKVGDCELTERKVVQGDDYTQTLRKLGIRMADLTKQHFAEGGVSDYHQKMAELETEHDRISAMPKKPLVIKRISTGKTFRQRWEEMNEDQRHAYLLSAGVTAKVVRADDADISVAYGLGARTADTADDSVLDIPVIIVREFTGPPPARSQAPKPGDS